MTTAAQALIGVQAGSSFRKTGAFLQDDKRVFPIKKGKLFTGNQKKNFRGKAKATKQRRDGLLYGKKAQVKKPVIQNDVIQEAKEAVYRTDGDGSVVVDLLMQPIVDEPARPEVRGWVNRAGRRRLGYVDAKTQTLENAQANNT